MPGRFCYESLGDFISHLETTGELVRITEKVSPILEITEITDRVSKSAGGGKALLFENVEGSSMPVFINAFGSLKRMSMSLGTDNLETIAQEIEALIHMKAPESWADKIAMLPRLFKMTKYPPKIVDDPSPPCQEIVYTGSDIDLSQLPVLKCWPDDGGRFITLPCVITKSPEGKRNVGVYRMQIFNNRSTGMHWHIHKDGATFFDEYKKQGRRMEVAVAIGCEPATVFAATAPMPPGVDELLLAGFIRERNVELVKCRTVDLEVPRTAEIVIEGYVEPGDTRIEGPFGDHTGYYSLAGKYPVFHVTAVTSRKNPVYLTTIVGKPPMEDCYMGKATERIFLPLLKTVTPEIEDYDLPWEGVFHNCVIISVKKRFPAQANKLMSALWGTGQMSFAKMILAVDAGINVHDYEEVAKTLLNNIDIKNGLIITEGLLDALDHSAPKPLHGAKLGIDATTPVDGEDQPEIESWAGRDAEPFTSHVNNVQNIKAYAIPFTNVKNPLAIIAVDKKKPWDGHNIARKAIEGDVKQAIKIIMAVDNNVDPADYSVALWKFFNNVDPKRDIFFENDRLFIDATKKMEDEWHPREWPDELAMSEDVKAKVDEMWPRLGL